MADDHARCVYFSALGGLDYLEPAVWRVNLRVDPVVRSDSDGEDAVFVDGVGVLVAIVDEMASADHNRECHLWSLARRPPPQQRPYSRRPPDIPTRFGGRSLLSPLLSLARCRNCGQ